MGCVNAFQLKPPTWPMRGLFLSAFPNCKFGSQRPLKNENFRESISKMSINLKYASLGGIREAQDDAMFEFH